MNIDIVIPSIGRQKKLTDSINSILHGIIKNNVRIYLDFSIKTELHYFLRYFASIDQIRLNLNTEYKVPEFWNRYLNTCSGDILVYLNDDILFYPDTISKIESYYLKYFPNLDGIIGFNQSNLKSSTNVEAAFGAIGKNYKKRFLDGKVWCEDYYRLYADKELELFAKSIGKFHYCPEIEIIHYHPAFNKTWEDNTHNDVRKYLAGDRETFKKRQAMGLLWGRDNQLINQKEK